MKIYRIRLDDFKIRFHDLVDSLDWNNRERVWARTILSDSIGTVFRSRNKAEFWARIILLSYTPTLPSSVHVLIEELNVENDK